MLNAYHKSANVSGGTGGGGTAPIADFNYKKYPSVYETIKFTSTSTGDGLTYQWYVDGANYGNASYINKVFSTVGNHLVVLTATNDFGSDTEFKTIYIST